MAPGAQDAPGGRMRRPDLLFAGEGHGAVAALRGLSRRFDRIALLTRDPDVSALAPTAPRRASVASAPEALVVMAGHKGVLGPNDLAGRRVLNVHYSLLPAYRGLHSVVWALLNDEPEIGLSVHCVDAGIDSGDVIHQHAYSVGETTTAWDVMEALDVHVAERLGDVVAAWLDGDLTPRAQDAERATWVTRRNLDDCLIDFDAGHRLLSLTFRALVEPYPLPRIRARGKALEVTAHRLVLRDYGLPTGRIVNVDADGAWIKTRDGLLVVQGLRDPDGHAPVDPRHALRPGQRL